MKTAAIAGAIIAASAQADVIDLDPGTPVRSFAEGPGTGRSIYLTANETFRVEGVGILAPLLGRGYEVVIQEGRGVSEQAGPVVASARGEAETGLRWHDLAIDFSFEGGAEYVVTWRPERPDGAWVFTNALVPYFEWGESTSDDVDLGLVTIRDGREGFDAFSHDNVLAPHLRLLLAPTPAPVPGSVVPLGLLGVAAVRRRR